MNASPRTTKLSHYLHATVAAVGTAVLILECLGVRMLTPLFGSAEFVWIGQLLVTALAVGTGYQMGVWFSNRGAGMDWPFRAILVAAAWLALSVNFRAPIVSAFREMGQPLGTCLTVGVLFFAPIALLASAVPMLLRLMNALDGGIQARRLTTLAIGGTVAGSVVAAAILALRIRESVALMAIAVAMEALVAVYMLSWSRPGQKPVLATEMLGEAAAAPVRTEDHGLIVAH